EREPEHLQIGHSESAAELRCVRGELPGSPGVARGISQIALVEGKPPMLRPCLDGIEQAVRAPQPTPRHRRPCMEVERVRRQPRRQARTARRVPSLPVQAVRALPRTEPRLLVVKPPSRPAQTLERLCRLLARERLLEERPRLDPPPSPEQRPTGPEP